MARVPDVIHRIELPLDDRPHGINLTQEILHAAVSRQGPVSVWFKARRDGQEHMRRSFQVVATGQPIPIYLDRHQATAVSPGGQLEWHVLENHCPHPSVVETPELGDKPGFGSGICADCHVILHGDGADGWIPT